jgi:hypothetical protein
LGSVISHSAVFSISHSCFGSPKLTAYKIYRSVDPSSLTPVWNPPEDRPLATNSKQPDRSQHPLINERLVGTLLKVVVNDGEKYKDREVVASIVKVEGVVSIRQCLKRLGPCVGVVKKIPIQHATMVFSW